MTDLQKQQLVIADLIMFWGLVVAVVIYIVKLVSYFIQKRNFSALVRSKRAVPPGQEDTNWSYTDWAGTLVTVGGALTILLGVQDNPAFTSLSVLCGIVLIALPAIYSLFNKQGGYVWIFLAVTTLTLWAVCCQLVAAFIFVGDLPLSNSFVLTTLAEHSLSNSVVLQAASLNLYAWLIRIILLVAAYAVIRYHLTTTREIIDTSKPGPTNPA